MKRSLFGILLSLSLFCGNSLGQSAPCAISDHAEYTKKIKVYTTEPFFITELVDHLPLSSCVPAPDAFLHHSFAALAVPANTRNSIAYIRLLPSRVPRERVFATGT